MVRCDAWPCHLEMGHELPHNAQSADGGLRVWPDLDPERCEERRHEDDRFDRYRCRLKVGHPAPHRASGSSWWPVDDEDEDVA